MVQHHYGWRGPGRPDHRDFVWHAPRVLLEALPARVDLDSPSPGDPFDPVFDQGQLGSCGPNAAAGNLVFDEVVMRAGNLMPSRLFIYYATRQVMGTVGQDSGVDNRSLLKALNQFGWCDETLWNYDVSRFTTLPSQVCWDQASLRKIAQYAAVPQSLDQMKACLAGGQPFLFGFTVYSSLETQAVAATGDVPMPSRREQVLGGHDVLFVGYDDASQRFKFRNSWGAGWGKSGYGTIPYAYATSASLAGDFWTITDAGIVPPPPPPPPPPPSGVSFRVLQAGTYTRTGD